MSQQILSAETSVDQARAQLGRLRDHWQAFWFELKDFHDNRRWLDLGYSSFKACVEAELAMSEQQAYRLLDASQIRSELATHPGVSIDSMTERQARELKPLTAEQRIEVAQSVDFRQTTVPELRVIVAPYRVQPPTPTQIPPGKFQCDSCGEIADESVWHCAGCDHHNSESLEECSNCHNFGPDGPTDQGQKVALEWDLARAWSGLAPQFEAFWPRVVAFEEEHGRVGTLGERGIPAWVGVLCFFVKGLKDEVPR